MHWRLGYVRLGALATMVAAFGAASLSPAAAQGTPEQQQLCSGDAMRLCGDMIPDVPRITACMVARRAELSPGCRSVFRYEPAPSETRAVPVRTARPGVAKPRKAKSARRRR